MSPWYLFLILLFVLLLLCLDKQRRNTSPLLEYFKKDEHEPRKRIEFGDLIPRDWQDVPTRRGDCNCRLYDGLGCRNGACGKGECNTRYSYRPGSMFAKFDGLCR